MEAGFAVLNRARNFRRLGISLLAIVWLGGLVSFASAQTYTWTGQALTGKWDQNSFSVTNWVGNVIPTSGAAAQLVFSSFANQEVTDQDIGNPFLLNGISFGGVSFTLDGNPLQFESNGGTGPYITLNTNTNQTINENLVLDAGLTINGSGNGTLTLANPITQTAAGNQGLTVSGAGTVLLSAVNTFAGNTTISSGQVSLGNGLALQKSTAVINLDSGLNLNGQASATIGGLSGTGALNLGNTALTVGGNNASTAYSGVIAPTSGSTTASLTKTGLGTLTLSGAGSNFHHLAVTSGSVTLGGGSLAVTSTSGEGTSTEALSIGSAAGPASLSVQGGATFDMSAASDAGIGVDGTTPSTVTVTGSGTKWFLPFQTNVGETGTGSLTVTTGASLSTGFGLLVGLAAEGALLVEGGASVTVLSGSLAANPGITGMATVTGSGSQWNNSTLDIGGFRQFGNGGAGTLLVDAGGAVVVNGLTQLWNSTSSVTVDGGTLTTGSLHSVSGSPSIALTDPVGGVALTIGSDNSDNTFSGTIANATGGPGGINKVGTGTLTLSGANTYTGSTLISAGTIKAVWNSGGTLSALPPGGAITNNASLILTINTNDAAFKGFITGTGTTTINGDGSFLNLGNPGDGSARLSANGDLTVNSRLNLEGNPQTVGALNGTGTITSNAGTGVLTTLTVGNNGHDGNFQGAIYDSSERVAVAKVGSGTQTLSASNYYSGGTTINAGTLVVQTVGLPATSIVVNSAGTLQYDTSGGNINQLRADLSCTGKLVMTGGHQLLFGNGGVNAINWNFSPGALIDVQGGTFVGGTSNNDNWTNDNASLNIASGATFSGVEANVRIDALTGAGIFSGGFAFGGIETIGVANGSGTFSGSLQDNVTGLGYDLSLVKVGTGTETLSGTNTNSGGTTVNNGTLTTTTTGTLGGGSLAVNGNSGATSVVNLGKNQSVTSLSSAVSGGGSARVNVGAGTTLTVNQSTGTTFAGSVALAAGATAGTGGVLAKSNGGALEIDGGLSLGNDSTLSVAGGMLRLKIISGSASVGSGITANITGSSVLELAGSVSALGTTTPANRVAITNGSTAAAGLLISAGNQQVGGIGGLGNTQVNAGASLTADHVIQGALIIGGTSDSHAVVTIDASDASGNPLDQSSGFVLANSLTPSGPFGADGISSSNLSSVSDGGTDLAAVSPDNSAVGGNLSPVPEPSSALLLVLGGIAFGGLKLRERRAQDARRRSQNRNVGGQHHGAAGVRS